VSVKLGGGEPSWILPLVFTIVGTVLTGSTLPIMITSLRVATTTVYTTAYYAAATGVAVGTGAVEGGRVVGRAARSGIVGAIRDASAGVRQVQAALASSTQAAGNTAGRVQSQALDVVVRGDDF
jgi:hypothetical protein